MIPEPMLQKLVTPQTHRKGATEEQIFAANEKARTTAKLASELGFVPSPASPKKAKELGSVKG